MAEFRNAGAIHADVSALNLVAEVPKGCPQEAEKVVMRVLLRVRDNARAEIVRSIPRVYAIPRQMVSAALLKERKRYVSLGNANGEVSISVVGSSLNMVRFPHTPSTSLYGGARLKVKSTVKVIKDNGSKQFKGVHGRRFNGGGKSKAASMTIKNVFLMPTSKSGGGIPYFFARRTGEAGGKGEKKEGVKGLSTVSIPQMLMNPKVAQPVLDYIAKQTEKRVEVELTNMVVGMQSGVKK